MRARVSKRARNCRKGGVYNIQMPHVRAKVLIRDTEMHVARNQSSRHACQKENEMRLPPVTRKESLMKRAVNRLVAQK